MYICTFERCCYSVCLLFLHLLIISISRIKLFWRWRTGNSTPVLCANFFISDVYCAEFAIFFILDINVSKYLI